MAKKLTHLRVTLSNPYKNGEEIQTTAPYMSEDEDSDASIIENFKSVYSQAIANGPRFYLEITNIEIIKR